MYALENFSKLLDYRLYFHFYLILPLSLQNGCNCLNSHQHREAHLYLYLVLHVLFMISHCGFFNCISPINNKFEHLIYVLALSGSVLWVALHIFAGNFYYLSFLLICRSYLYIWLLIPCQLYGSKRFPPIFFLYE